MSQTYHKIDCHTIPVTEERILLFKPYSLALMEIDRVTYDILQSDYPVTRQKMLRKLSRRYERESVISAISELRRWRILVTKRDVAKLRTTPSPVAPTAATAEGDTIPIWLCVSNDCNLRCNYCSAGYGRFGGEPGLMSKETARKAIDMYVGSRYLKGCKLDVVLIGGEPLINFGVVRYVIDLIEQLARSSQATCRFGLNTNGTVLTDEIIAYLSQHPVDMVFSVDGQEHVHDRNRRFANGNGSYGVVATNMKRWVEATGRQCRVQSTVTNMADMEPGIKHFYDMGIRLVIANPALNTLHSPIGRNPGATEQDQIVAVYSKMARDLVDSARRGAPRGLFSTVQLMSKIHRRDAKGPGCGAGIAVVVDSFGDIYPCQGLVGWKDHKLGHVDSGIDEVARRRFLDKMSAYVKKCIGCWAQSICGAACIATAIANDTLEAECPSVECELRKRLAAIAIETYADLIATAPQVADRFLGTGPRR